MKKIYNETVNIECIGKTVTLGSWVAKRRELGGLIFIDLRDRTGLIQLVVNPESEYYELASTLKSEYVINVTGKVVERISSNEKLSTGKIEVIVEELNIPKDDLEWYTNLRRFGGCYHSGFGLGFERLIMYLTGIENIRDVIPYPRTPGNCEF